MKKAISPPKPPRFEMSPIAAPKPRSGSANLLPADFEGVGLAVFEFVGVPVAAASPSVPFAVLVELDLEV